MKERIIGTGITKRKEVSYDLTTPEEVKKHFNAPSGLENQILKPIEKTAWEALRKAGFTRQRLLKAIPRIMGRRTGPGKLDCFVIQAAKTMTADRVDTPEWFAARWLHNIRDIRLLWQSRPDVALEEAFLLGQSYGVAVLKFRAEPLALPFIEGRSKGGRNRGARNIGRDEKIRSEYDHLSRYRDDAIHILSNPTHWAKHIDPKLKPLSSARLRAIIRPRSRK